MSTLLMVTGIVLAVFALTFVYLKKKQSHQPNLKPERSEKSNEKPAFPENYGKSQLNLLVRDPYWLYAYWEITATVQTEFSKQFGDIWNSSKPLLRLYDITDNNNKVYYDIQIQDYADSWYIHTGRPNHTFFVDLGRVLPDGKFYCIARSNTVTAPSNHISHIIDPNWMPIDAIWNTLTPYEGSSSQELVEGRCN